MDISIKWQLKYEIVFASLWQGMDVYTKKNNMCIEGSMKFCKVLKQNSLTVDISAPFLVIKPV